MKNKNELGIYIHIPFCVHKCIYCDFLSSPADEKTRKRYVKALIREINLAAEGKTNSCINKYNNESNNHGKDIVTSIFIGGGTPSVIDASDIKDIIEAVRHNYNVSDEAEITIECNPGTMDEKKAAKKLQRWQAIAESAAKQSKRTVIPTVKQPVIYKEALKIASELDITLVPYENERGMDATREIMGQLKDGQTIGVVVGPEGGFAPEEIALVDEHATMHRISLGRRILRTETAGLAALAMLVYNLDV